VQLVKINIETEVVFPSKLREMFSLCILIFAFSFFSAFPIFPQSVQNYGNNFRRCFSSQNYNHVDPKQWQLIDTIPNYESWRPKVALVLSGGGARGLAQVGTLEVLTGNGIPIDYIVGTSIGAIIGGLYAVGYTPNQLDSIIKSQNWDEILSAKSDIRRRYQFLEQKEVSDRSIFTLRFKNFEPQLPEALSVGNSLYEFLQKLVWHGIYQYNEDFNCLKAPFRAVATDLASGKTVTLKNGDLVSSIRASSAVPLKFSPVRIDSMILVDGGLMANTPVNIARDFNADLVLLVNTESPLLEPSEIDDPLSIADQVISVSMMYFSKLSSSKADITIKPNLTQKNDDFSNLDSLINIGKSAAKAKVAYIKQYLDIKADSIFKLKLGAIISPKTVEAENFSLSFLGFEPADSISLSLYYSRIYSTEQWQRFLKELSELSSSGKYSHLMIFKRRDGSDYQISANAYPVLNSILIEGLPDSISREITQNLELKHTAKHITPSLVETIAEEALFFLRLKGNSLAMIQRIDFDYSRNRLILDIDESRINRLEFCGNESIGKGLIQRDVTFSENQAVNVSQLMQTWENLQGTGYFSSVNMHINRNSEGKGINVKISLAERGMQQLSFGGRVDNERYAQVGVDFIQENLIGFGERFSFNIGGGSRDFRTSVGFEEPRFIRTFLTLNSEIYYNSRNVFLYKRNENTSVFRNVQQRYGENIEERFGVRGSLGILIEKSARLAVELRSERQRTYTADSSIKPPWYTINTIKIGGIFDSRDRSDFPRDGRLMKISIETSLLQDPSIVGFSKAEYFHSIYYTYGSSTINTKAYFGFADATLPQQEFFSLGGADSFYGMRQDESRGSQVMCLSLEYRLKAPFKLLFDTYFSLRYDLGSIWGLPDAIRFNDLKHGAGFCVALDTPLGPAKINAGKSFYFLKKPAGVVWGDTLLYFSLGMDL
jgi:NTE family protein